MSVFDKIFGGQPTPAPAAPAAPSPATPGNIPGTVDPNAPAPSPTPATPVEPTEPNSPLDEFKTLWEPVTTEGDDPGTPTQLDPVKLKEVISKADFTKSLNQENLSQIAAGGEGAIAAFTDALNQVARQVLEHSTLAANQMQEQRISEALAKQAATLPDLIKAQSLSNSLQTKNPIFSNPAITPIMDAVKAQLVAKNPTATADQLTEMAQNYVLAMGEAFSPAAPTSEGTPGESVNWDKFLDLK